MRERACYAVSFTSFPLSSRTLKGPFRNTEPLAVRPSPPKPGGSKAAGADAYATSKQCTLATALEFARETPRLHFNAVEPGFNPATALGREANAFVRFLLKRVLPLLVPVMKYWSTPKQAARVITNVVLNPSGEAPASVYLIDATNLAASFSFFERFECLFQQLVEPDAMSSAIFFQLGVELLPYSGVESLPHLLRDEANDFAPSCSQS